MKPEDEYSAKNSGRVRVGQGARALRDPRVYACIMTRVPRRALSRGIPRTNQKRNVCGCTISASPRRFYSVSMATVQNVCACTYTSVMYTSWRIAVVCLCTQVIMIRSNAGGISQNMSFYFLFYNYCHFNYINKKKKQVIRLSWKFTLGRRYAFL